MFDILTKRKLKARPSRRRLDGAGSWVVGVAKNTKTPSSFEERGFC